MNASLALENAPASAAAQEAAPSRAREALGFALDATLRSYARVIFARRRAVGALLLLATLSTPAIGLAGLLGSALATSVALLLGMDRALAREGVYGLNGLLTGLVLGAFLAPSLQLLALAPALALLVVLIHVSLGTALQYHLRLPVLSLPFVLACWLSLAAASPTQMVWRPLAGAANTPAFPGPAELERLLGALGAIFAVPTWTAGALVLAALVLWSRIGASYGLLGYAAARLFELTVLQRPGALDPMTLGFNVVLTSVALGGVFFIPGRASLALALGTSLATVALSAGLAEPLARLGLPLLALPFNLMVMVTLYALAQRTGLGGPRPVTLPRESPEEVLAAHALSERRFGRAVSVALRLPFRGSWVVTQGNEGEHTHQGLWRHGLDFEVMGPDGQRHEGAGERVQDWRAYGLPVCAMAAGTVVRVVSELPDNKVGEADTKQPWGNLVVVQHGPALFSLVAHLQPHSVQVVLGQYVTAGQVLGRCGNSGRSPVPHLHVQLQATPTPGAPTLPIAFHGVVLEGRDADTLLAEHLPQEGESLRNPAVDPELRDALAFPQGQQLRAEVRVGEETHEEVLSSEIDPLGRRSLASDRGGRLWFDSGEGGFVAYDHEGPRDGALFALYCALPRAPLSAEALSWSDNLNPRRLERSPLAWLLDGLSPWLPQANVPVHLRSRCEGPLLTVEAEVQGRVPRRTQLQVRKGRGLERVRVEGGPAPVEASCSSL
ncbi:MAG: urea transporter [Alphaproteobacteria bacterium]|nr:urea transporter [Alphaproteobacteria bacterium]